MVNGSCLAWPSVIESAAVDILSFSASHRDLGLAMLEQLSTSSYRLPRLVINALPVIRGAVVLATCNRLEIYFEVDPRVTAVVQSAVAQQLSRSSGMPLAVVTESLRARSGLDAVHHLYEVACGLDSMVVGEREINGQVRRALAAARREGTASTLLEQVFQRASRVSRQVDAATGLGAHGRSVVSVALGLAAQSAPPWPAASALVVGTGSYAGAAVVALRARGCTDVQVYSPSGRATEFAASRDLVAVEQEDLTVALAGTDIVVSCSGRWGPVIDAVTVAAARLRITDAASRTTPRGDPRRSPLVLIDLALARDIETTAADIEGVQLIDLAAIEAHAPVTSQKTVAAARECVALAVSDLQGWVTERQAVADIVWLREVAYRELTGVGTPAPVRGAVAVDGQQVEGVVARDLRRTVLANLHADIVRAKAAARERVARDVRSS